ncbi:MAG TPA: hypothetical protein VGK81_01025, partial [Anaerolineae bacterium]
MSLYGIIAPILRIPDFQSLADATRSHALVRERGLGLLRAARPALISALHCELRWPIVYLTSSVELSRNATDALKSIALTGAEQTSIPSYIQRFTEPNTAFYDTVAPVLDVTLQRSVALASLSARGIESAELPIIVASPRSLMHPTLPLAQFRAATRVLRRDQTIGLESTLAHWVNLGYVNESVVERIGAFSRRGGIIDVWPPAHTLPARIELFGNQIESIRLFDPSTQRSGEMLDRLVITPLESMRPADAPMATLLDYLGDNVLVVIDDEDELHDGWIALENKAERERETMLPTEEGEEPSRAAGAVSTPLANQPGAMVVPYVQWDAMAQVIQRQTNVLVLGQAAGAPVLSRHP